MIFLERLHWLSWGMDRKEGKTEDYGVEFSVMEKNIIAKLMYYSPIMFSFGSQYPALQEHSTNVYQKKG